MTNLLVWQWGRRGAGPRYAAELAEALGAVPGVRSVLSLSTQSELLGIVGAPGCELPIGTYDGIATAAWRVLTSPLRVGALAERLQRLRLDAAICAMPAVLDVLMAGALRRAGVPFAVVVHDADLHPGDQLALQMPLHRLLLHRADALVALSTHVATRLREQRLARRKPVFMSALPPFAYAAPAAPPLAHGGRVRLLTFGRLLPYKGLDLLGEALRRLGPRYDFELRVVGSGPESRALAALRALAGVTVENRWVPEAEVGELFAWADALVLPYREASQSGVAAAAVTAGRWLIATRVGGLAEQLSEEELALLCEPEAGSLAAAIARLLETPPPRGRPSPELAAVWRASVAGLLHDLHAHLIGPRRV